MKKRKTGKYSKKTEQKNSKTGRIIGIVAVIVLISGLLIGGFLIYSGSGSVFMQIQKKGYAGTQEQWLASLAGECCEEAENAYELACRNGYRGSHGQWLKTITGVSSGDESMAAYDLACENGYIGTLEQWLTQLAEHPEDLGRSRNPDEATSYELACRFGYTGTFIEWIVSVSQDKAFR